MKKTLVILVFILTLFGCDQGPLIENYKIEGISIGDTLLDFMSEKEIVKQITNPQISYDHLDPPNKFLEIFWSHGLETYSEVSVFVENGDKKYIIQGMFGELKNSSIEKCLEEKSKTIEEFDILFKDESRVQSSDYAGRIGFIYEHSYILNTSDRATVQCYDRPGYLDHNSLLISLTSSFLGEWLFVN